MAGHMVCTLRKQKRIDAVACLDLISLPFHSFQDSNPWNGLTHVQGGLSHFNEPNLEGSLQTHPECCVLGNSSSCKGDNQCSLS